MDLPPETTPSRKPRTFELRDAEWIEDAPKPRHPPLWLLVPVGIIAVSTLALLMFGAVAAVVIGGLIAVRAAFSRGLARLFRR